MTQFSVIAILPSSKTKGTEIILVVPFALSNYRSVQSWSSAIFLRFLHCPPSHLISEYFCPSGEPDSHGFWQLFCSCRTYFLAHYPSLYFWYSPPSVVNFILKIGFIVTPFF